MKWNIFLGRKTQGKLVVTKWVCKSFKSISHPFLITWLFFVVVKTNSNQYLYPDIRYYYMYILGGSENWAWKRIELHTSAHQDNHLRTLNPKYYNSLRPSSLVILTSKFWNASLKSIPNVDSIQRHFCSVGRTLLLPDLNNWKQQTGRAGRTDSCCCQLHMK